MTDRYLSALASGNGRAEGTGRETCMRVIREYFEPHMTEPSLTLHVCSRCGHELAKSWYYCPECGSEIEEVAE